MSLTDDPIQSISQPGILEPNDRAYELRREVAELLGRSQTNFPGAQPVSFARSHITEALMKEDYYVCEKSDGIRYLLYLTDDEEGNETQYFIDRKNNYWRNPNRNLHFPLPDDKQAFHRGTLVDGELVMDDEGNGQMVPRFLMFDCLTLDGTNLMDRTLDKRLAYFGQNVYEPYKALLEQYPGEKQFQPFELGQKNMQFSYGVEIVLKSIRGLKHGNDGLIFTCRNTPYKHGTDPHILKWKPADENTVDCKLMLDWNMVEPDEEDISEGITEAYPDYEAIPKATLHTWMGDSGGSARYRFFREAHITQEEWEKLKALGDPLDGRIVECYLDEQKRWRISRFRDDKENGNHQSVVESVLSSIEDGVTSKELIGARDDIREAWKSRVRA